MKERRLNDNMNRFVYNNIPLPNQAADYLTQWILDSGFQPGDKLPTEVTLAKNLGVGRGTVREAIMILKSRNLVEVRRGCGTFVSQAPGQIEDPLGLNFVQDQAKLAMDWCKVRMIIEPQVSAMAALNATEEDLAHLKKAGEQLNDDVVAGRPHLDSDLEFHKAIAAASGNIVMYKLVPVIMEGVEKFMTITNHEPPPHTQGLHNELLVAILGRDAQSAQRITEALLVENQEYLKKVGNN